MGRSSSDWGPTERYRLGPCPRKVQSAGGGTTPTAQPPLELVEHIPASPPAWPSCQWSLSLVRLLSLWDLGFSSHLVQKEKLGLSVGGRGILGQWVKVKLRGHVSSKVSLRSLVSEGFQGSMAQPLGREQAPAKGVAWRGRKSKMQMRPGLLSLGKGHLHRHRVLVTIPYGLP